MASIVVGVDEAGRCAGAVDWAVAEARLRGAQLHVLHCCDRYYCRTLAGTVAGISRVAHDVPVVARSATTSPETALLVAARDAAMLVVGPPGNSRGIGELLARSTGMHVALRAACPVVIAHAHDVAAENRVVVGIDRPEESDAVLGAAFYEADIRRAALTVVAVKSTAPAAALDDLERELITTYLQPWQAKYPLVGTEVRVPHGKPTWALTDAAGGAALLVVGTRRQLAHLGLRGESVTPRIVASAHSPVLFVRKTHRQPG